MLRFKKQKITRAVKGFRLPTLEYEEDLLDIADRLVIDADNTYYMQMTGSAMEQYGLPPGAILVVDKSLKACSGCIVIAFFNGDWLVREYHKVGEQVILKCDDPLQDIITENGETLNVWGVVMAVVSCVLPKVLKTGRYADVCAC